MYHPGNVYHSVMADCIEYLFEKIDQAGHASLNAFELGLTEEKILQENLNLAPVIGNSFENIRLLDKRIYMQRHILTRVVSIRQIHSCKALRWMISFR